MGKKEKLQNKIENLSKTVSYQELVSYLIGKGFSLSRSSGSHHIFRNNGERLVITSPHGSNNNKYIPVYQLRQVLECIKRLEKRKE